MNKWFEIFIGLILLVLAVLIAWYSPVWWGGFWNLRHAAWEFLKGGIFWVIAGLGLLLILLGLSDLRE